MVRQWTLNPPLEGSNPSTPALVMGAERPPFSFHCSQHGSKGFKVKRCATCGELKPEDEYNWRNRLRGKRWGTCKKCQNKQTADWYQRNKETHKAQTLARKASKREVAREFVWDYLSDHPCVDCGETDPVVLEFDHVRGKKRADISKLVTEGYSLEIVQEEITKCEVVCRNCHIRRTHKSQATWRSKQ